MKQSYLLLLIGLVSFSSRAQYVYESWNNISVIQNGKTLAYPFLGGLNAGQFNELDLNSDGIMDLVILDRSGSRLSTFINNGTANQVDYQYEPSYTKYFPDMRNWLITRDYNCDGKMDLFVGSSNIMVYANVTGADKVLAFALVDKIKSAFNKYEFNDTTRSTINAGSANKPAIYDVGNDGDLDLLFFDQNGSKMEYHRNLSVENTGNCGLEFERRSKCWGDFTESNLTGTLYLDSCRFGDLPNPEGDASKTEKLNNKGAKHAGSSVSGFDFYNRGSTDLIIGDVSGTGLTAMYNADSLAPFTNSHFYAKDSLFPKYDVPIYLPLFPAAYFLDINNDSKKDMLVTTNSNVYGSYTKSRNNILHYKNKGADTSQFELQSQSNLFYDNMIDVGKGCNPSFFDYNKDGLLDMVIGNIGYLNASLNTVEAQLALYKNTGSSTNPAFELISDNYLNLPAYPLDIQNNAPTQNAQLSFGDLDADGDLDMILGDFNGVLHYFIDTATAGAEAKFKLETVFFEKIEALSEASPQLFDVDRDGKLDLILGHTGGRIEYYPNLGTEQLPQFTLKVNSIKWLNGDTIRYELARNPNLKKLSIGQQVDVNYSQNNNNGVFQNIARIDSNGLFIDLIHPFRVDATDDELSSNAIIDYSNKKWGNVDIIAVDNNRDADPILYLEEGELKLIVAGRYGNLYFYDSLEQHINSGSFHLLDSNFLEIKEGFSINIGGGDLNQDGKLDLAIGNEAGGFILLKALHGVGIQEYNSTKQEESTISIYPNPGSGQLYIESLNKDNPMRLIKVYDARGKEIDQLIANSSKMQFDASNWSSGVYFFYIQTRNGIEIKKVIIRP